MRVARREEIAGPARKPARAVNVLRLFDSHREFLGGAVGIDLRRRGLPIPVGSAGLNSKPAGKREIRPGVRLFREFRRCCGGY